MNISIKKRLCIIIPAHWEAIMGGSQYQAKMLIDYLLAKKQYEIHYLARRTSDSFRPDGYTISRVADPHGIRRYGEFLDIFDLLKLLDKISPDIIYQRVGCGYTGIAAYYARRNAKRCIWHVAHDREVMPLEIQYTRKLMFRYIDKKFLEYGLRNADTIVTQTQQQADYLEKYYRRTADAVIPNVHPVPVETVHKEGAITVVWVANLKPWKHPEIFIRLAKDLKYIDGVKFIMIGHPVGDPEWCQVIRKEAESAGNLEYLGGQSQNFVNDVLAKAHIFVNTSDHEGFANTFIQSWLRRVPVISLAVNPDGIFDRHNVGIYAGTYDKLKESLIRLIDDVALRTEMGEEASRFANERYSFKNMERLEHIIAGVPD